MFSLVLFQKTDYVSTETLQKATTFPRAQTAQQKEDRRSHLVPFCILLPK